MIDLINLYLNQVNPNLVIEPSLGEVFGWNMQLGADSPKPRMTVPAHYPFGARRKGGNRLTMTGLVPQTAFQQLPEHISEGMVEVNPSDSD